MRIMRIPKGPGKFRTIYAPDEREKAEYRRLLPQLEVIAKQRCPPETVHGFMPGRSPLTNAMAHIGHEYTLSMDLQDFFDHVTWRQLRWLLPEDLVDRVLYEGAARQGLPTSPVVANIAASPMDWELLKELGSRVTYTRYADDLAFSFNDRAVMDVIVEKVPEIIRKNNFVINPRKTKLQAAAAGRRVVTGVAVDGLRAYPTRKARRKLRAARHQGNIGSMRGLEEWCRLKPPAQLQEELQAMYNKLRKALVLLNSEEGPKDYGKEQRSLQL